MKCPTMKKNIWRIDNESFFSCKLLRSLMVLSSPQYKCLIIQICFFRGIVLEGCRKSTAFSRDPMFSIPTQHGILSSDPASFPLITFRVACAPMTTDTLWTCWGERGKCLSQLESVDDVSETQETGRASPTQARRARRRCVGTHSTQQISSKAFPVIRSEFSDQYTKKTYTL